MTKKIKVAGMELTVPTAGSDIGKAVEQITNDYEAGKITALFVVYSTEDGLVHVNTGNNMVIPFVCLAASAYAGDTLNDIEDALVNRDDDNDE